MRRVAGIVAAVAPLVLGAGWAQAAGNKYSKKETEIQATQTAITKPSLKPKDEKKKPAITAADVFGGVGEKIKSVTDAQIGVLKQLLDNTDDNDPEKPDIIFRLAELYNEQQRYYNFRARELDQKVFESQQAGNNPLANQQKTQQTDYQNKEKAWLLAAVGEYLKVADHPEKYGSYKRTDEVLFYLAYLLQQVKKDEASRKYFKRLIKDYPKSKFVAYAYLSFGEYFFENKDLENALKFYDKVLEFTDSSIYGYAKYKEGWCYFNLGDFKQALATFVGVIELSERANTPGSKSSKIALGKEAKKDSVRAYARIGTPEKAWDFFRRIGGSYAMTMMEQLGELYNGQGQFADSIKVYRNLMVLEPQSPKLCSWQNEVMKNTLSMTGSRATPETVKELQRLAAVYDRVKNNPNLKRDQLDECRDNTANMLRELATVWHKEAQKTNNNDTYALAQYLYREYLNKFPKEKDAYVMTFYYAELLWKLGSNGDNQKYCEAAPVYTHVIELDPRPQAKWLREAALASVLAWKNCLDVEDSAQDTTAAQQAKRQEGKENKGPDRFASRVIPDKVKKMLEAYDTYVKYVPDSPDLPSIKYRKARIYYEYNYFDKAIPLFREIAEKHQDSDLSTYSANLLFDSLVIKNDYDGLETALNDFCGPESKITARDLEFKKVCGGLQTSTLRLRIIDMEKKGKNREAATRYLQLAQQHPDDPKVDELYYNAASLFEKAKLIGLAIQAREALLRVRPDSTLAKRALYLIGRNYQDIAAFDQAADKYEQFASRFAGEKEASTALYTASFFRRGLGETDKALSDTALFVKNYGGRKEFIDKAASVAFDEGKIFQEQRDWDKLEKHLTNYLKFWGTKGGVDRQVLAHVMLGEVLWRQSCPLGNGVNGACIEVHRVRAGGAAKVAEKQKRQKGKHKRAGSDLPKQCGPETKSQIAVHERKPALVKEAMGHLETALKLYRGGLAEKQVPGENEADHNTRVLVMRNYAAHARMIEGDAEYEQFLRLSIPDKLDFASAPAGASPGRIKAIKARNDESVKRFTGWFQQKTKQLASAQKIYNNVILMKDAHYAIAASARLGQLFQDFSNQLYTAPVPKAGASPVQGYPQEDWERDFHDAYCDAFVDKAEPLEAKAIEGLSTCLSKSTELSWYNEWSVLCEAELNQIKPAEYPLASEIRAQPGYVAVSMDRAQVQPLESK